PGRDGFRRPGRSDRGGRRTGGNPRGARAAPRARPGPAAATPPLGLRAHARVRQEAVTMSFWDADSGDVVSVLLDRDQGGGIKNIWVGASEGVLERTREMSLHDPSMVFEMITQADARGRMDRAIAAGECPQQPEEVSNVASRRAILRARVDLLHR